MASSTTERRVSLAEIMSLPEFQSATEGQQLWLKVYLATGEGTGKYDALKATRIAFPKTSAKSLAARSCNIQSHKRVKQILAVAFGRPVMASILSGLDVAIRRSIKADMKNGGGLSVATTRAVQFYENQRRLELRKEATNDDTQKFSIGEIFRQGGTLYRVDAIEIEETK
jgi:hypothetical protein